MMYVFATNSELEETNRLPNAARKLVDGEPTGDWVMALPSASVELQEACGYFKVEEGDKPPTKSNQYLERNLVIRYGKPVIEWKRKIKKLEDQMEESRQEVKKKAASSRKAIDKYLASPNPSMGLMRETLNEIAGFVKLLHEERFPNA